MLTILCSNALDEKQDKMCLKIKKNSTLLDLRNVLEKKRKFNSLYFLNSNNNYITKEEEKNFFIENFKIINFTDIINITVKLGGEFLCKIDYKNISLTELRQELEEKITLQDKFFFNDSFIIDEENFNIFEICKNNIIEINHISDNIYSKLLIEENPKKEKKVSRENNDNSISSINNPKIKQNDKTNKIIINYRKEPIKLIPNNNVKMIESNQESNTRLSSNPIIENNKSKNMKRSQSLALEKINKKNIKYKIIFDNDVEDSYLYVDCFPDSTLKQVKGSFPSKYKDYIFLYEGFPIYEEDIKISDLSKDNKIYLTRNNESKFYKKINKDGIYKYYLYENNKFNEEEEKNCISILLVGETGVGKTTFLNCFINFILKVNFFDKHRYLLVNEPNNGHSSKTTSVNIYYIKSHNSYPPIKIIDTPGFGDTSGYEFDKKIVKMIYEKFKEINELSSVCIICKYNETRFDFSKRYIFNSIINLFGKDMAENFMILFSFSDVGEVISKQNFENKDSPFYKIINSIKKPWYLKFNNSGFLSENQNSINEEFYKMGMESYTLLLNKLKTLKKIKLKISSDVNIKREKLDNIISYVKKKLINIVKLRCNSSYQYSDESLNIYYCQYCNFFGEYSTCIICNSPTKLDYCNKNFNFRGSNLKGDNLILKDTFEFYSNLFLLENLAKKYNNISLKESVETIKEFITQIKKEYSQYTNFQEQISYIINTYEQYRNLFNSYKYETKDFPFFIFKQLMN